MSNGFRTIADNLGLSDQEALQQIDTARRLLGMAIAGVPRREGVQVCKELLALHALATAYMAIAKCTPAINGIAGELLGEVSQRLASAQARSTHAATATADFH